MCIYVFWKNNKCALVCAVARQTNLDWETKEKSCPKEEKQLQGGSQFRCNKLNAGAIG